MLPVGQWDFEVQPYDAVADDHFLEDFTGERLRKKG